MYVYLFGFTSLFFILSKYIYFSIFSFNLFKYIFIFHLYVSGVHLLGHLFCQKMPRTKKKTSSSVPFCQRKRVWSSCNPFCQRMQAAVQGFAFISTLLGLIYWVSFAQQILSHTDAVTFDRKQTPSETIHLPSTTGAFCQSTRIWMSHGWTWVQRQGSFVCGAFCQSTTDYWKVPFVKAPGAP